MSPSRQVDVVVVGASAGGVHALRQLVSDLPAGLDAGVFIVLHTLPSAESLLPQVLNTVSSIPAVQAADGTLFETGRIYVAPPDRHLLFQDGTVRVIRGPKENRHRPSIDVLFRSAAMAHGANVLGVLLSGSDDDGSAGLMSIKHRGGLTIVQNPSDAAYPHMPQNALRTVGPDFILPIAEIGPLIKNLVEGENQNSSEAGMSELENNPAGHEEVPPQDTNSIGVPSAFTCPDCSGTLWELQDGELLRYRCRVGHAYSSDSMIDAQSDAVERALWSAVRTLEESASICRRIASKTTILQRELNQKAEERQEHARVIRKLLLEGTA
ncbi:MAG: chemotaxis protein CheB [Acidobacteriia bacterium]|nr:chemotaxis protein CheB [Terriglobia bacterium]